MRRRGRVWLTLAVVAAVSACGSTVQVRSSGQVNNDGLSPVAGGPSTLDTGGGGAQGGLVSGPGTGNAAVPAGTGGQVGPALTTTGGGGTPGGAGPSLRSTYRGVTDKVIYLGLATAKSTDSTGKQIGDAYGVSGFSSASDRPIQNAMVAYLNRQGGINGRKLVPIYHEYDPNDTRTYVTQSQESCAFYNDDHKVFAHINVVADPVFYSCMEHAGTVGVERYEIGSQQLSEKYRGVFTTSDLNYTTAGALLVDGLVHNGFLTSSSKIGLIQADTPDFDLARRNGMEKSLTAAGLKLAETYRISPVNTTSDAASVITDANSAVLKFHTDGIDRVLFLTSYGGLLDAIFMKEASAQKYYPKYGLSSHDAPVALGGGNAPADQLDGARVVGWAPFDDLANVPSGQVASSEGLCLRIIRAAGVPVPSDRGQHNQYVSYCSSFLLFAKIARAAGPELTRSSFIQAGESLGGGYLDPFAIRGLSRIGAGSHQSIVAWQGLAYSAGCSCFQPSSPVVRFR